MRKFWDEFILRGGEYKTCENFKFKFFKKKMEGGGGGGEGKTVIYKKSREKS